VSSKGTLPVSAQDQIAAWQVAQLKTTSLVDDAFQSIEPIVVVIWLAGQANGHVFAFYNNTQPVTVKYNGDWYTLENTKLHTLLPWLSEPAS
jgi:hypothetical protein